MFEPREMRRQIFFTERRRARARRRPSLDVLEAYVLLSNLPPIDVTQTTDDGLGSTPNTLSWAIDKVNADTGDLTSDPDVIDFDVDGGSAQTINAEPLPEITNPVVIDGTSQPGYAGTPLIRISDASHQSTVANGFDFGPGADFSTIKGLIITYFDTGAAIDVSSAEFVTITGNDIGVLPAPLSLTRANAYGIELDSSDNTIGGTTAADANIIGGNYFPGIYITGFGSSSGDNLIEGNQIGMSSDSLGNQTGDGNAFNGVLIDDSPRNQIDNNLIEGNQPDGIRVVVDNNTQYAGIDNSFLGNSIWGNSGYTSGTPLNENPGIDLIDNGYTGPGSGAGSLFESAPVITSVAYSSDMTVVSGTYNSDVLNEPTVIQFFANGPTVFPDGYGFPIGGQTYLSEIDAMPVRYGTNTFVAEFGALPSGQNIVTATASATYPTLNTSEFSNAVQAAPLSPLAVTNTNSYGAGSLYAAIEYAETDSVSTVQTISFEIPNSDFNDANGVYEIEPLSDLPTFTTPIVIDGTSEPGYTGTPIIQLDGSITSGIGVWLAAGSAGSTIEALDITDWYEGIQIDSSDNQIVGNEIGLTVAGVLAPNTEGLWIDGSGNTVGGTTAATRNVISGNGNDGVFFDPNANFGGVSGSASGNLVEGDYIGTDATGSDPLGNGNGINLYDGATDNTIGGTATVAGNVISGNQYGVYLQSAGTSGNVVAGNDIGTDYTGMVAVGNVVAGVFVSSSDNTIGGTAAGAGNVISANGEAGEYFVPGVEIFGTGASDNVVSGNAIGTDMTGTAALGNHGDGVDIDFGASGNTIGGTAAGAGNTIEANANDGIEIDGQGINPTTSNVVEGNNIGTDLADAATLGNAYNGIEVDNGAESNTIGGTASGASNVISGNEYDGVMLDGTGTSGNVVVGNSITANASGTFGQFNYYGGVGINSSASGNAIGGTAAGAGNVIDDNLGEGVIVGDDNTDPTVQNKILGNSIHDNTGLGIDLGSEGVVTLDHSSPTTGIIAGAPNGDQNFPVLASAAFVPDVSDANGTLIVSGSLAADINKTYIIQVFANSAVDPSGYGQGQTLVGSFYVSTDGSGNVVFFKSLATANLMGEVISATATDPSGNTSEFAMDKIVATGAESTINIPIGGSAAATQTAVQQAVSELQSLPSGTSRPSVLLQVTSLSRARFGHRGD